MKKIILFLFLSNIVLAQKYVVFENNKKNKALFDYNDPNSLVSMLVQNREKIIENNTRDGMITTGVNEYSVHPIDGLSSFSVLGPSWKIERLNTGDSWLIMRESVNENFEDWYTRLTTIGDSIVYDPADYEALTRIDKSVLKKQYDICAAHQSLRLPNEIGYYDLNHIDLIIADSLNIYFARKSPYENKHFICLNLKIDELKGLERLDYLNETISKTITSKLREHQLKKKELETAEGPAFNLQEYETYRQGTLFNDHNEDEFKVYQKTSCIKRIFPGDFWTIQGDDEAATLTTLTRDSEKETFESWFERLTTQGKEPDYNPDYFAPLLRIKKNILKNQYDKCGENQPIKYPDFEAIYWVDYPDPAVYLKRSFSKDSLGKFKTSFSQLLFTERLNNKKGFDQKPQVLMSFGAYFYEYDENLISQEILDLLKVELVPFSLNKEFSWQQIISNRKGNKISNENLKKLIHCTDIDENGIQY